MSSIPALDTHEITLPPDFTPASSPIPWTNEQQLVHSHMAVSRQTIPLMVNSLAGTGKSSSTVFGVNTYMDWAESIMLTAFGREAAEQLQAKLSRPSAQSLNFH